MPGVRPPMPPAPDPFDDGQRDRLRAEFDEALAALPDEAPVPTERLERIGENLLGDRTPTGDEVTEARMIAARLADTAPNTAGLLRRLADARSRQIADREPAWIVGNPASALYRA